MKGAFSFFTGILLLLGAAGGADCGTLSMAGIIFWGCAGLLALIAGAVSLHER